LRYASALADPASGNAHVSNAYASLRRDLRNWDLDTGYYIEASQDEASGSARVMLRHSWPHFAALLNPSAPAANAE
jgi:hypothetical protein